LALTKTLVDYVLPRQPVSVTFVRNCVTLGIQAAIHSRDQEIRETIRISASYQLQRTDGTRSWSPSEVDVVTQPQELEQCRKSR